MKEVIVEVIMYEAEDGERFDNPEDAIHYEKIKNGTRRVCKYCHGTGTLRSDNLIHLDACKGCNKKGWVEKVEVWK